MSRRLRYLIGAIVLVDTMFFAALTPLLPHYAHELHLSKAGAGFLSATYALGAFIAALPAGLLASRLGVRPTVLLGLTVMGLTSVVFGLAHSAWLLDVARLLQGAASACSWTAGFAWLVAAAPVDRRNAVVGSALGAAIGGALLGPVLGTVAALIGPGTAFGSVAALAVVLGVWAARTPAHAPQAAQPLVRVLQALRAPRVLAGVWFILLPSLLFGVLTVLAPLRLSRLGWSSAAIGGTFVLAAAGEAALSPWLGRIADRRGLAVPLRAGLAGSFLIAVALPWPDGAWLLAALVVIAGLAFGAFWVPGFALLAEGSASLGLDYALGFALMNLAWSPGQGAGSWLGGTVAAATSDAVPYLALAAICLISLVAVTLRFRDGGAAAPGPVAVDGQAS